MSRWERETCIRFKERTTEEDYVYIFRGAGYILSNLTNFIYSSKLNKSIILQLIN